MIYARRMSEYAEPSWLQKETESEAEGRAV